MNNTNETSHTKDLSFCFSCGFNFGHIADGIEDTTMGMILVGIVLLVVMFSSCLSCYFYYNCGNKEEDIEDSGKRRKKKKKNDDEKDEK
jgi:hypothetical protein